MSLDAVAVAREAAGSVEADGRLPTLAAVTLDGSGGGIAAAARLVWRVFQEHWESRLVELLPPEPQTLHPSPLDRLRFGAEILKAQWNGTPWLFFGHLGLAKALAPVPRGLRPPYGVCLYGVEAWRRLGPAERALVTDAALRLTISRYTANRVQLSNPELPAIDVCPLALEPVAEVDATTGPLAGQDGGPPTVLLVGRMAAKEQYKGHDQLIEAWPLVRRAVADARLVLVGDGDDGARLRAKAAALGVGQSVVFTGFVSDRVRTELYRTAHLFAMPSRGEGFGLVYLEAMAHGLACIGSTQDAAGEVIVDGTTGYLVDQNDHVSLVARATGLLLDRARREAMGRAGRERLMAEFSYAQFRSRLFGFLDRAFIKPARNGHGRR